MAREATWEHGTRARYTFGGCRCEECRRANADYARRRSLWNYQSPHVEAAPVREHVLSLLSSRYHGAHDGMGRRRIAAVSGVTDSVIQHLIYGRNGKMSRRIKRENAEKLMAVGRDLSPAAVVDAADTWLYLNEMIDFGIPKTRITGALGKSRHGGLRVGRIRVTVGTARKVEQLHWRIFKASPDFRRHCGHLMPDHVADSLEEAEGLAARMRKAGLA